MALIEFLQKRIRELEVELPTTEQAIAQMQERMADADRRRSAESETEKYHKWNQICVHMEEDLDKAKAKLAKCQAELKERRERLAEAEEQARREAEEKARAEAEREQVKKEFMSMSVEELGNLSMEDIARLQAAELGQDGDSEEKPAATRTRIDERIDPAEAERSKKRKIRLALEKVLREQDDGVGWEELDLLLAGYAERTGAGKQKDDILLRLERFLRNRAKRCAAFCAAWRETAGK